MSKTQLHIQPDLTDVRLEGMSAIYQTSFPSQERTDWSVLAHALKAGHLGFVTAEDSTVVKGFAVTQFSARGRFVYLLFLAVDEQTRGLGIGALILQALVEQMRSTGTADGILLEVEAPEAGAGAEVALRERRIGFYMRNGARLIDELGVVQMPDATGHGTLALKLMWIPFDPAQSAIARDTIRKYVVALLGDGYGLDSDDPLVQAAVRHLDQP